MEDSDPYGDFKVPGCMDDKALNYNPDATEDDGSCKYPEIKKKESEEKVEDCSKLKKVYELIILAIIVTFILILILILLNKNKNNIKSLSNNSTGENPFVIHLN